MQHLEHDPFGDAQQLGDLWHSISAKSRRLIASRHPGGRLPLGHRRLDLAVATAHRPPAPYSVRAARPAVPLASWRHIEIAAGKAVSSLARLPRRHKQDVTYYTTYYTTYYILSRICQPAVEHQTTEEDVRKLTSQVNRTV